MTSKERMPAMQPDESPQEIRSQTLSDREILTDELAPVPEDIYYELPPWDKEGAIEFLRYLREDDDAEEQRETMEYLIRVLDEDRPSYRKLFPEELKGVTW
jgi:hypothetical protein